MKVFVAVTLYWSPAFPRKPITYKLAAMSSEAVSFHVAQNKDSFVWRQILTLTFPYGSKAWWPLASNILRLFWGNHSESSLISIKCYSVELLERNSITKNCGKNSHYHNSKPTFHVWQMHRIVVIGIHARKLVLFHGVENGRSDCVTHWCLSQRVGI